MLTALLRDLRYALRNLARNPGFAAVAIAVLALGIGANSAVFTVVNSVLLRPLNFYKSDQLILVQDRNLKHGFPQFSLSPGNYVDYRDHNRSFSGLAAFQGASFNLSGGPEPEHLDGARITIEFFRVLAVKPILGRTFSPEEMKPGSDHVVMLGDALWHRRFGGRPDIVGQTVRLNGEPYTVVGVVPRIFPEGVPASNVWTPLALEQAEWQQRGGHYLNGIGRLKDGVTLAAAQTDLNTIAARAAQQFPPTNADWDTTSNTLQEDLVGDLRPLMWSLSAVVGAVLLIACVNLANLLLSRTAARRREIAIRSSLGAGRGRLIQQLLTESILLAAIGAVFGLALAWAGARLLVNLAPDMLPRMNEIGLDWRVLGFTAAVALATGILFGLAPALNLARTNLASAVREGGRGSSIGFRRNRLRSVLVIGEVAMALVLLASAGMAIRSFSNVQSADPGFDAHHVLTFATDLPEAQYKNKTQRAAFYGRVLERIRQLPGVDSAGVSQIFPFTGSNYILGLVQIGKPPVPQGQEPDIEYHSASPGYFTALRIPIKAGRDFTDHDDANGAPVAIISEAAAQKYYPGENPLGQQLRVTNDSKPATIIGIAGNANQQDMRTAEMAAVYEPAAQDPFLTMMFAVRAKNDPAALIPAVRSAIHEADSDLPLDSLGTVDSLVAKSILVNRFAAWLVGAFAALALVLAMVGIYGVLSYAVTQATQEIGIRVALGAKRGDVLRIVMGHAAALMGAGFIIGIAGAFAVGRLIAAELYKVSAEDPVTYGLVALVLAATGVAACAVPAMRAMSVDPVVALREE